MDLFLASSDYIDFETPIRIIHWEKKIVFNRPCLVVDLEKPIDYTEYGIQSMTSRFLLLDRFTNTRLLELIEFPIEVHVLIPENVEFPTLFKKWDELFNAAWAKVYNSYESAMRHD